MTEEYGHQKPEETWEPAWHEDTGQPTEPDVPQDDNERPQAVEDDGDHEGDPRYIEERHMLLDDLVEDDGPGRPPIVRQLISSRYVSRYRLRTSEDGDLAFVKIPPVYRPVADAPVVRGQGLVYQPRELEERPRLGSQALHDNRGGFTLYGRQ